MKANELRRKWRKDRERDTIREMNLDEDRLNKLEEIRLREKENGS